MLIELVSTLTIVAGSLTVPSPRQQAQAGAYLDDGAAELLRKARERRTMIDRSVSGYTAVVQEHISAGLRTLARERMMFRRDVAGRVEWNREGPVRMEVLGAREVIPPVLQGAQLPEDLEQFMPHLAFDPVDAESLIRLDTTFVRHPIAPDGERWYRYQSGDTIMIRLQGGREIRLAELVVIPRENDVHLISGSFWLDTDTHSVVRTVFRPAKAYELADFEEDDDDVPGFIKPIRAELLYITIEYGLWELRWWMPRLVAAEGVFQISFMTMPLKYERAYSNFSVRGDTTVVAVVDTLTEMERCRAEFRMSVTARIGEEDSAAVARRREREAELAAERAERGEDRCIQEVEVTIPDDEEALLESDWLPPDPYTTDAAFMTPTELRNLEAQLRDMAEAPWEAQKPTFDWGLGAAGLVRYNRIEALSVGARTEWDLGRIRADLTARLGVADLEPNAELSIIRETPARSLTLTGYRRLAAANAESRALSFGNSFNALMFGRDDGEYFRAAGAELIVRPPVTRRQWYDLRLYAEHQTRADVETDFSLHHALDSEYLFRPNMAARRADQYGAALTLRAQHGFDPVGFRIGADLAVTGETGTFGFGRAALTIRSAAPLFAGAMIGLEAAAGTTTGDVPPQAEWFLGGPATLRGYRAAIRNGNAFWRGRIELSRGLPVARIALFSGLGWAGDRNDFETSRPLQAVGAGATFLDGLVRFDMARGVRKPTGWRVDLWVGSAF